MGAVPRPLQDAEERVGGLGAGDAERAVDDEERDGADVHRRRPYLVLPDVVGVRVAVEDRGRLCLVETGVHRQPQERGPLADGLALGEGGQQQSLLDCVLDAAGRAQMDEAMGIEGVARLGTVEAEVEPDLSCGRRHPGQLGARLAKGDAVLAGDARCVVTLANRGRPRIELEGAPHDPHLVAVLEPLEGGLEVALADVAPRADDIGPDLHSHTTYNHREAADSPVGWQDEVAVADVRVRVLGGFEVEDTDAAAFGSRKVRTLLKVLALARGRAVSTDALVDSLWGDAPPARPADQVSVLVSRLRSVLGSDRITRDDAGYRLHADWLDLDALEDLVVEAEHRLASHAPAAAGAAAGAALALARGPVLPDEPDAEWAQADRARAERLVGRAARAGAEASLAAGDPAGAADLAEACLTRDAYDEAALRTLMRAHVAAGRPGSALAAYARARQRLAEDLGVDPSAETEALHTEILLAPAQVTPVALAATPELAGREAALAGLDRALGRGGLFVVSGEAGIGKTRLLDAWAAGATGRGVLVLRGRCEELARSLPLQAVMDALAHHLASLEPSVADGVLGSERDVLAPLLGQLPAASRAGEGADHAAGQALVFGALVTVLGRVARGRPTALVLDDVHLAGSMTVEWLHFIARRGAPDHVLVVAAHRPEEGLPLPAVDQVQLGPIDLRAAAAIVGERRAAELHQRSGGHPLFLVELAANDERDALPASVRDAVAARCDRAGPAAVSLRAAAVLGPDADLDLLAGALRAPPVELLGHLEEGVRRRLLVETSTGFAFAHDLVREALVETAGPARRALLHREAGRVLAARRGADPRAVAHHARLGGDLQLAADALVDAASEASARYDQAEAARLLDDAISLQDSDRARLERAHVRLLLGEYAGALDDAVVAKSRGAGPEALEIEAWASYYSRDFTGALAAADEGATSAQDAGVRSGCLALGGWTRLSMGALREAAPRLDAAVAAADRPHAMALVGLGGLHVFQGRPAEGLSVLERVSDAPGEPSMALAATYGYLLRGMALGHSGRAVDAIAEFDEMEQRVTRRGLDRFSGRADNLKAWVLRNLGATGQANECNERALEVATSRELLEPQCHALADLAAGEVMAGDFDGAAAHLDAHDAVADRNHALPWRHIMRTRLLRGRIALATGNHDGAAHAGADVIATAADLDMPRYALLGRLLLAQVELGRGGRDLDMTGRLLEELPTQAGLEAWWLTAETARLAGVDSWWALAARRVAELALHAGPHRDVLETAAARQLAR